MKRIITRMTSAILAIVMLLSATACGANINAIKLSSGYTGNVSRTTVVSQDQKSSVIGFAAEFFSQLSKTQDGNVLVSPVSLLYCLTLLANGADGNTLKQIEDTVGMDLDDLNRFAAAFSESLYNGDGCKVSLANSAWIKNDPALVVEEGFLQANADWLDAEVFASDFGEETLKDINSWVSENTDGMINNVLESIDPGMLMYLINTLLFDSEWETKYKNSQIKDEVFTNYDSSTTSVNMMSSKESIYYSYGAAQGFAKKYKGGAYSFVAILPDENVDIYDFAANMDADFFNNYLKSGKYGEVYAKIPEFKFESELIELNEILASMGMEDMFIQSKANFRKMGHYGDLGLMVDFISQKTVIDVSRNGTKAAAVTIGGIKATSIPRDEVHYVYLDRPFVYAIIDTNTNIPLFMGITANL
ncbi:MAG: serine protease inhibitor [Clostridiales bacterium]|nr:serine protease inhibitor [Clostridiales bacterium]